MAGEFLAMSEGEYKSGVGLSKILVTLLIINIALDLTAVESDFLELSLLERLEQGESVTVSEAEESDERQRIIALAQLGLFLFTAAFFIAWFHRIYKNLLALGASDLRFAPGWAIGAWFVPFLNLVRPKQIADDIWRASEPGGHPDGGGNWTGAEFDSDSFSLRSVPVFVHLWWGLFLLQGAVGRILFRPSTSSLSDLINTSRLTLAVDILGVAVGVLAIMVVRRFTFRQETQVQRLGSQKLKRVAEDASPLQAEGPQRSKNS